MAKRPVGNKKTAKEAMSKEFENAAKGLQLLGEIITWGLEDKVHTHQSVLNALTAAGLSTAPAKAILPKHAFTRAQKKLAEDRVIDTVAKDGDKISFQFTKRAMQSKEWVYSKECNVILDTATGTIECEDKKLEKHAQKLLDQCIEDRTTADVTKIIQKLFDAEADLFPIRDQGGVYFVPIKFQDFVAKIEAFVLGLGGRVNRFPVPAGTQVGNRSVADSVAAGFDAAISDLNAATDAFTINTRSDTLANQAKYIRDCKVKVQAYAVLLQDKVDEALDNVTHADNRLLAKLKKLEQDRANAPAEAVKAQYVIFGHAVTAILRWMGSKGWKKDKVEAVLESFDIEISDSTIGCQLGGWEKRGKIPELTKEQVADLEQRAEEVMAA